MSHIIFEGDYVRNDGQWYRVEKIVSSMKVRIDDGRILLADETDIDAVLSEGEYQESDLCK